MAAGAFITGMLGGFASSAAGAFFAPWTRGFHYGANILNRNLLPGADELISAYWANLIPRSTTSRALQYLGIEWPIQQDWQSRNFYIRLWERVIAARQPFFDATQFRQWFRQGRVSDVAIGRILDRLGYDEWQQGLFLASSNPLNVDQLLDYWHRFGFQPGMLQKGLAAAGYPDTATQTRLIELSKVLPGTGDMIRFAMRGLYDAQFAPAVGLDAEPPPALRDWLKKLRVTESAGQDWPKLLYNGSLNMPGLNELAMMLWRLRPGRESRFEPVVPGIQPFNGIDYDRALAAGGWVDKYQPWLKAISHSMPRIQLIRGGVQYGIINQREAKEQYLDRGFLPDDAETMVKIDLRRKYEYDKRWQIAQEDRSRGRLMASIIEQYDIGGITYATAQQGLDNLGLGSGTISRILDGVDISHAAALLKTAISTIKRAYLNGQITAGEAQLRLVQAGVTTQRIALYLTTWGLQLSTTRKHLVTGQILQMVAGGILTYAQGLLRLQNLGWESPDDLLLMAQAEAKLAKSLAAQAKAAQPRIPAADLKKYLKDGTISPDEFERAMVGKGYPEKYVKNLIDDTLKPPKPKAAPKAGRSMIEKWHKAGVIDDDTQTKLLTDLGYTDETAQRELESEQRQQSSVRKPKGRSPKGTVP